MAELSPRTWYTGWRADFTQEGQLFPNYRWYNVWHAYPEGHIARPSTIASDRAHILVEELGLRAFVEIFPRCSMVRVPEMKDLLQVVNPLEDYQGFHEQGNKV